MAPFFLEPSSGNSGLECELIIPTVHPLVIPTDHPLVIPTDHPLVIPTDHP